MEDVEIVPDRVRIVYVIELVLFPGLVFAIALSITLLIYFGESFITSILPLEQSSDPNFQADNGVAVAIFITVLYTMLSSILLLHIISLVFLLINGSDRRKAFWHKGWVVMQTISSALGTMFFVIGGSLMHVVWWWYFLFVLGYIYRIYSIYVINRYSKYLRKRHKMSRVTTSQVASSSTRRI